MLIAKVTTGGNLKRLVQVSSLGETTSATGYAPVLERSLSQVQYESRAARFYGVLADDNQVGDLASYSGR